VLPPVGASPLCRDMYFFSYVARDSRDSICGEGWQGRSVVSGSRIPRDPCACALHSCKDLETAARVLCRSLETPAGMLRRDLEAPQRAERPKGPILQNGGQTMGRLWARYGYTMGAGTVSVCGRGDGNHWGGKGEYSSLFDNLSRPGAEPLCYCCCCWPLG
jgi:hypothetical protein